VLTGKVQLRNLRSFSGMNILVISASMRGESQSLKIAEYLCTRLKTQDQNAWVLDLHAVKLPIYDDGETVAESKGEILRQISDADGFVFVSPEWNGMMSHGLLNLMHYVKNEMAHKPVMLVGVSSGRGGTYPLAQMRLMGHKNTHYVISPENLIVGGVNDMLNNQNMDNSAADISVKKRAEYALTILVEYAKALKNIRDSGVVDMSIFPSGV